MLTRATEEAGSEQLGSLRQVEGIPAAVLEAVPRTARSIPHAGVPTRPPRCEGSDHMQSGADQYWPERVVRWVWSSWPSAPGPMLSLNPALRRPARDAGLRRRHGIAAVSLGQFLAPRVATVRLGRGVIDVAPVTALIPMPSARTPSRKRAGRLSSLICTPRSAGSGAPHRARGARQAWRGRNRGTAVVRLGGAGRGGRFGAFALRAFLRRPVCVGESGSFPR